MNTLKPIPDNTDKIVLCLPNRPPKCGTHANIWAYDSRNQSTLLWKSGWMWSNISDIRYELAEALEFYGFDLSVDDILNSTEIRFSKYIKRYLDELAKIPSCKKLYGIGGLSENLPWLVESCKDIVIVKTKNPDDLVASLLRVIASKTNIAVLELIESYEIMKSYEIAAERFSKQLPTILVEFSDFYETK
jgi:hypothetical protein